MYGNWIITVQFDIGAPEAINLGTGKRSSYCLDVPLSGRQFDEGKGRLRHEGVIQNKHVLMHDCRDERNQISIRVPISMTRLAGILKKSAAFMAFLDNARNRLSRHFIMPGLWLETIKAREMKNEVDIMSKGNPCVPHNSKATGRSGVSINP
jgi:hypothetical protein